MKSHLDIQTICPLHGPVLSENLGYYLNLYNTWSSYSVESEGIVIAYTSVYGNTKKAVGLIENGSWAPQAVKTMKAMLEGCKDLTYTDTTVKIISALDDNSKAQIGALAGELTKGDWKYE